MSTGEAHEQGRILRVAIADDTPEIRFLLHRFLDLDPRFEVAGEAGTGAEAIELVADARPDLLLLDLSMPVMDGLTALPEIRRRSPETVVVVFSGFGAVEMREDALRLGAVDYVEKGAPLDEVVARLLAVAPTRPVPPPGPRPRQSTLATLVKELRSPLEAISGCARLLSSDPPPDPAALRSTAEVVARNAKALSRLVDAIADAGAIAAGALQLDPAQVDLAALVREETADLVAGDPRVVAHRGPERLPVVADGARVAQIVRNLVCNVLHHTPAGTPFETEIEVEQTQVRVTVRDYGQGLDPDALERAFERFVVLDSPRQTRGPGMGLHMARALAEAHGGRLDARLPPDGGTAFELVLPLEPVGETAAAGP